MKNDTFTLRDYGRRPTFSSFLPGIAGEKGIPLWCYYNNRGQAVCSFGVRDKDHSIMEFSAAHVAYQNVARTGFRTFLTVDGAPQPEPFADGLGTMHIAPNALDLSWQNDRVRVEVGYFTLPESPVGALCRTVTVTNLGAAGRFRLLDGMPALVPYGVEQDALKNMTQLARAWMQTEDAADGLAFYRTRASMADTAVVTAVEGGNFALGMTEDGTRLPAVADPRAVFGYDTALETPVTFYSGDFAKAVAGQATQNLFPCAFFLREADLPAGGTLQLFELYGQAGSKALFRDFAASRRMDAGWFRAARTRDAALTDTLCSAAATATADPVFDGYCAVTYLDNLLRGGEPVRFCDGDAQNVFYLYSRKHGDPEREYNYFTMLPEYYSQGNGNYRDVNQNRRCDVLFHPWVGDADIRQFFSLLQCDGYNPLVVEQMTFRCADPDAAAAAVAPADRPAARALLADEFTPGRLAMAAEHWQFEQGDADSFVQKVIAHADCEPNASFGEGYWTDHWTYDLDLIESYLAVWPEQAARMLYDTPLPWYAPRALVKPRSERYCATEQGLRPRDFLRSCTPQGKWTVTADGATARSSVMEKLVLLCAVKAATLDPAGIGIEMEGGKPGWYDALNGLPGLLGSSVAESCELARLLAFTADRLERDGRSVTLYTEMADFVEALAALPQTLTPAERWDRANTLKEQYRDALAAGLSGRTRTLDAAATAAALRGLETVVREGLDRGIRMAGGVCPTYLMFPDGPDSDPQVLPLFLEGPTRWLKLCTRTEPARAMAGAVRASALYDGALQMYKVNESLQDLTFEAGRCRAFTPGWLENESIWLHMEYKYLLELLKAGLYDEFDRDFHTAAVPFLDPDVYGRSPLENVSFLASSANPDPSLHGRGFVARLSGSTAEFLQMRQILFFGKTPFVEQDGQLTLCLQPALPAYLIPADGTVTARFLGSCDVVYHIQPGTVVRPGCCCVGPFTLQQADGTTRTVSAVTGDDARALRDGRIVRLDVTIGKEAQ